MLLERRPNARLSFLLQTANPDFVGITALPIDTCPARQTIHVSNLVTFDDGSGRRFGTTAALDAQVLLPVTGANVTFATEAAGTVSALDLFGTAVAACTVAANGTGSLSLAGQPYGTYSLAGQPAEACGGEKTFAFMPQAARALGLIDLVLAQPAGSVAPAAACPVVIDGGQIAIHTAELALVFAARPTVWTYYIVSQGQGRFSPDLTISGTDVDRQVPMAFTKSEQTLPNGDAAVMFQAESAVAMRANPTARYSLSGQRSGTTGHNSQIIIARLPNAPSAPVWPLHGRSGSGISEIFVYI